VEKRRRSATKKTKKKSEDECGRRTEKDEQTEQEG
jgi:hypothetical protein